MAPLWRPQRDRRSPKPYRGSPPFTVALQSGSVSRRTPAVASQIPSVTRSLRIPSSSMAALQECVSGSASVSSRPTPARR